jgi:hypothetical protein
MKFREFYKLNESNDAVQGAIRNLNSALNLVQEVAKNPNNDWTQIDPIMRQLAKTVQGGSNMQSIWGQIRDIALKHLEQAPSYGYQTRDVDMNSYRKAIEPLIERFLDQYNQTMQKLDPNFVPKNPGGMHLIPL